MIRTLLILFFVLCVAKHALSRDLGTHGHTYEIVEPDLLQQILSKLKACEEEGTLKSHQEMMRKKAEDSVRRPPAVSGITRTTQASTRYYDPSIMVPYDLRDHEGKIFQKGGQKINPLTKRSLTKPLLFIDGDDEEQVKWASQHSKVRVVLVKGAPFELMEAWNRPGPGEPDSAQPVFFDQGGTLTKKLGIQHVPTRVVQEGLSLKIEEIMLPEVQS